MQVKKATAGTRGFDIDRPLSEDEYKTFAANGYCFAVRYLPRSPGPFSGDLTTKEIEAAHGAKIAISAVQHVAPDNWYPHGLLGTQYGRCAAQYASEIGLPPGMHLWLDLEGVAAGSVSGDVVAYCHGWAAAVSLKGYLHGLYVGWHSGLNDRQLYDLPFDAYWRGYNADQSVPTRGYQMIQSVEETLEGIAFDPDLIQVDKLGDLPTLLFPS